MRLRACHVPWKFKASGGAGSPGGADGAGPDSFLDTKIDKSSSMPAPLRVEEDAMPRRLHITRAVLNQYGITDGCVGCASSTIGRTGNPTFQRSAVAGSIWR